MATPTGQYALLDNKNLIGLFDKIYEEHFADSWATRVGTYVGSTLATETYGWLGAAPSLEELKGDMAEEQFNKFSYALANVEYAKAIKIAEKDMRRDKIGQLQMRIGEMAEKAAMHWNSLVTTLITSNGNGYDGAAFFSTSHAESGSNQKNLLTSTEVSALDVTTATAPTPDEAAKCVQGVIGKFYELTDDKGDPINGTARDFTVMCPTAEIWGPMRHAVAAENLSSGASNPLRGLQGEGIKIDVVLNPLLRAQTSNFYVFRNDSPVKSFILQEEVAVEPVVSSKDNDEYIKFRRFLFSIYTSRAAGYGRWQSAMKATLS